MPAGAEPVAVTLITGDTVSWQDSGDGNPRLEIDQAPREEPVSFDQYGSQEDFYVIPSDAMTHVVAGTLDEELFNVPGLIRQGLADADADELPVIVTFDQGRSSSELTRDADALPATSRPAPVERLNGAGIKVHRSQAGRFRQAVLGERPRGGAARTSAAPALGDAVERIYLDQMLKIDLTESVPQIGAPQAWDAGYTGEGVTVAVLDTGVDFDHPDLVGQIVAAENFTDEPDATDDHGHGTHVASTIAGTGAASDGARTGVAPEADLMVGKVCFPNDAGQGVCPTSAIMAGMEWAATQGADVVNMSLGGGPTNGTDPLSQLVNDLTAESDTLFVVSAGNAPCIPVLGFIQRVSSPAAADAALAVGAVDKSEQIAPFSSCGPRVGDHAVKPEITAPGVGIVAARAQGTSAGVPVNDRYTSIDGTSMAAPHVAGAAALLTQATGLTGAELKDALVSTAADGGSLWYRQGTGRVDVPAALNSPVLAQGTVTFGGIKDRTERNITYRNYSDADATLTLDTRISDVGGQIIEDVISLSDGTVTVPAGGRATIALTMDPADLPSTEIGLGGGVVTATGDGVRLRTAVGFGPVQHSLTIEVLDSHGNRIGTQLAEDRPVHIDHDTYDPANPVGDLNYRFDTVEGIATGLLPTGTFSVYTVVTEVDAKTGRESRGSLLVALDVAIEADTTIVLDARDAVPVEVTVPQEADLRSHQVYLLRQRLSVGPGIVETVGVGGAQYPVYATPTPPSDFGFAALLVHWVLAEPQSVHPLPWDGRCPRLPFTCYSEAPGYVYNLPFLYENGIPDDLHEKVDRRDLVKVPSRYHSDHSDDTFINHQFEAFPPVPFFISTVGFRIWIQPGEVTEYFLADDRFTWVRLAFPNYSPEGTRPSRDFQYGQISSDWFSVAEAGKRRAEERWLEGPPRTGAVDIRQEYFLTPGDAQRIATASRGGADGNQFIPGYQIMDHTRGHAIDVSSLMPSLASWRMWNLDTGAEIAGLEYNPDSKPGVPAFTLPSELATYRLEQTGRYPAAAGELFRSGPIDTTWTFTSRSSSQQVSDGYRCPHPLVDQDPRACQIQPLIQFEYQLNLDVHNQAPADRPFLFTILAGHHSRAVDQARVTSLRVEASYDDGLTWHDARILGKPRDRFDTGGLLRSAEPYQQFRVLLKHPPLHQSNGFVALRLYAEDANGGTVEQIAHRAYALR